MVHLSVPGMKTITDQLLPNYGGVRDWLIKNPNVL
jgi:hypothetical protein